MSDLLPSPAAAAPAVTAAPRTAAVPSVGSASTAAAAVDAAAPAVVGTAAGNPVLGVDINIILHMVAFKVDILQDGISGFVDEVLAALTPYLQAGFDLLLVNDAETRHASKLASFERIAQTQLRRAKLARLHTQLRAAAPTDDTSRLTNSVRQLKRAVRGVPPGAWAALEAKVATEPQLRARVRLMRAKWQADNQLVHFLRCDNAEVDAVATADGDLLILGAPFVVRMGVKGIPVGSVQLGAFSKRPLRDLFPLLHIAPPKHTDIFEMDDPADVRALCAVILGCDQCPRGVPGVSLVTLKRWLEELGATRSFETLLAKIPVRVPRDVVLTAVQAMLYEPVFVSAEAATSATHPGLCYMSGVPPPRELLRFLADFALLGVSLGTPRDATALRATAPCATGHEVQQYYNGKQCAACRRWFCALCALVPPAAPDHASDAALEDENDFVCAGCVAAELDAEVDTSELVPRFSSFDDCGFETVLRDHFKLVQFDDLPPALQSLKEPQGVQLASSSTLDLFFTTVGLPGSTKWSLVTKKQMATAVLQGKLDVVARDLSPDAKTEMAKGRALVEAGLASPSAFWWTRTWPHPAVLLPFERSTFEQLQPTELKALLQLVGKLTEPGPTVERALGGGLHSAFVLASAERCHGASGQRALRYGRRTASAVATDWTRDVLESQIGFVDVQDVGPVLVVSVAVHKSFVREEYSTTVWLSSQQLEASQCTCLVGRAVCHHAVSILVQLQGLIDEEGGSFLPVLLDVVARRGPLTDDTWTLVERLVRYVNPDVKDEAALHALFVPGTETATLAPPKPRTACVHRLARELRFASPEKQLQKKRKHGADAAALLLTPSCSLDDYNPFPAGFEHSTVDYPAVAKAYRDASHDDPKISQSAFYWVLQLRANAVGNSAATESPVAMAVERSTAPAPAATVSGTKLKQRGCWFVGCSCTTTTCRTRGTFRALPRVSNVDQVAKNTALRTKRIARRRLALERCGVSRSTPLGCDVRICACHPWGTDRLPEPVGVKLAAPPTVPSRGLAADRARDAYLRAVCADPDSHTIFQQSVDIEQLTTENVDLRDSAATAYARGHANGRITPVRFADFVLPGGDARMCQKTGFSSVAAFRAFVGFLTNCNTSVLEGLRRFRPGSVKNGVYVESSVRSGHSGRGKKKQLSGEDMLLLYFMHEYLREADVHWLVLEFQVDDATVRKIVITCARLVELRWKAFGHYLTYDEQQELSSPEVLKLWGARRVIYWDTTNVVLNGKPSDAVMNWATWSKYYHMNCLKAGVGLLSCLWLVPGALTDGGTSDSRYMTLAGVLQNQQELAESDDGPPATNVTDKGMRAGDKAFEFGCQSIITPFFRIACAALFTIVECVFSKFLARDRAVNERAVLLTKRFGFVTRGVCLGTRLDVVDRVWHNCVLRANVIFGPLNASVLPVWEQRFKPQVE